jgi:hypothetical protein
VPVFTTTSHSDAFPVNHKDYRATPQEEPGKDIEANHIHMNQNTIYAISKYFILHPAEALKNFTLKVPS